MTYTETIRLDEELQRLRDRKDDLAAKAAEAEPGSDLAARYQQQGSLLEKRIRGVRWALEDAHTERALPTRDGSGRPCPVWDDAVDELVFKPVVAELPLIRDEIGSKASALDLRSTEGMSQVRTIAYGTSEAPYHDPDVDVDQRVTAVSQLPDEFRQWAEAVILDLSTLGNGNETSFAAAVAKRRSETQEDEEEGEATSSAEPGSTPET